MYLGTQRFNKSSKEKLSMQRDFSEGVLMFVTYLSS